jgi:hypothetical protein
MVEPILTDIKRMSTNLNLLDSKIDFTTKGIKIEQRSLFVLLIYLCVLCGLFFYLFLVIFHTEPGMVRQLFSYICDILISEYLSTNPILIKSS